MLRDGRWSEEEAAVLVPGDIISIKLGDIIPADARLLDGDPLKIDQVLTSCTYFYYFGLIVFLLFFPPLIWTSLSDLFSTLSLYSYSLLSLESLCL